MTERCRNRQLVEYAYRLVNAAEGLMVRHREWCKRDREDEAADMLWPLLLSQALHPN